MPESEKQVSGLSDHELSAETKKKRSARLLNALIIGFLIGIIVYSVVKNTWGLVTIIPLFFVFKLNNNENGRQ